MMVPEIPINDSLYVSLEITWKQLNLWKNLVSSWVLTTQSKDIWLIYVVYTTIIFVNYKDL